MEQYSPASAFVMPHRHVQLLNVSLNNWRDVWNASTTFSSLAPPPLPMSVLCPYILPNSPHLSLTIVIYRCEWININIICHLFFVPFYLFNIILKIDSLEISHYAPQYHSFSSLPCSVFTVVASPQKKRKPHFAPSSCPPLLLCQHIRVV